MSGSIEVITYSDGSPELPPEIQAWQLERIQWAIHKMLQAEQTARARIFAHQDYLDDIHEVSEEPRPSDFTGKAGLVRCFPWLDEVTGRWSGQAGR